ncbi:MAG: hypothetical protein J5534_07375 [Fibrobacter sp.]|nr:hypothetical protein [Fibrobacter sp.]
MSIPKWVRMVVPFLKKVGASDAVQKVENGMDALWDFGKWGDEKNGKILKEHLRTPYRNK